MTICKDNVEIYPVRETHSGFEPIFEAEMHGHTHGETAGAYANLRQHRLRRDLESRGLSCVTGDTHRVRITPMVLNGLRMRALCAQGGERTEQGLLTGLLGAAAAAGLASGATHIEIKVS